jgi:hypothetical protein
MYRYISKGLCRHYFPFFILDSVHSSPPLVLSHNTYILLFPASTYAHLLLTLIWAFREIIGVCTALFWVGVRVFFFVTCLDVAIHAQLSMYFILQLSELVQKLLFDQHSRVIAVTG